MDGGGERERDEVYVLHPFLTQMLLMQEVIDVDCRDFSEPSVVVVVWERRIRLTSCDYSINGVTAYNY